MLVPTPGAEWNASLMPPGLYAYELAHSNDNMQPRLIVAGILCLSIASVACALRIWARRVSKIALGLDDLAILVALILAAAMMGLVMAAVRAGLGRHLIFVEDAPKFAKVSPNGTRAERMQIFGTYADVRGR